MNIGSTIKQLRKSMGISQTTLASKLCVTSQAISKWENDQASPDISLLPEIAAILGVSIDDLFDYSKEKEYEKIENSILYEREITNNQFIQMEQFLQLEINHNLENHHAISLLADLYEYYAGELEEKAFKLATRALDLEPNNKSNMTSINHVLHGKCFDYIASNHDRIIDFWYSLLQKDPRNSRAYQYLLDDLIDVNRLEEAKQVLAKARELEDIEMYEIYALMIQSKEVGFNQVKDQYIALSSQYEKNWKIQYSIANELCFHECYKEAIIYWQKGFDVMEKPRYTDFYEAIARCYCKLNQPQEAIEYLRKKKKLLENDWNIHFGKEIDSIVQEIERLSKQKGGF